MEELTVEQVKELIEKVYCKKYIGYIKLTPLKNMFDNIFGYKLDLGMGCDDQPLQIAFDGTASEFMERLETRLRQDHLADETYSYGVRGFSYEDVAKNPRIK